MFQDWQREKAIAGVVDAAQAVADKLETAKPHIRDSYAAYAQFWAASHLQGKQNLFDLARWKPEAVTRFIAATETRITALRKQRDYDSSDGLAVWLHTARAVTEPRVAPAVRQIWRLLLEAGPNADAMADDLFADANLPPRPKLCIPQGFQAGE